MNSSYKRTQDHVDKPFEQKSFCDDDNDVEQIFSLKKFGAENTIKKNNASRLMNLAISNIVFDQFYFDKTNNENFKITCV